MSKKLAIVKKCGIFLELSEDGEKPLPREICRPLEDALCYSSFKPSFRTDKYSVNGSRNGDYINERLYSYDEQGRMILMRGMFPRISEYLKSKSYDVLLLERGMQDKDLERPDRYVEDFDAVMAAFKFRPEQDICLAQMSAHDFGIVDAIPAFGKMYMIAMMCLLYPHAKIDIVTKSTQVCESIYDLILHYTPNVGRVGGGHKHHARITVYTADSLHHSRCEADILLCDEVHELVNDDKMRMLARYGNARMFGFTATKETRADNMWRRLELLFGRTVFFMDYPRGVELGLVVPMIVQWLEIKMYEDPTAGMESKVERNRWGIWRNEVRNSAIGGICKQCLSEGLQTLVLVDTIDHALHLRQHMPAGTELCYGAGAMQNDRERRYYESRGLLGKDDFMTSDRRELLREQFSSREVMCVIATSTWHVGVSFNSLQVVVRGDGAESDTRSVQLPGRVGRIDPKTGKEVGILVDCWDIWNSRFKDKAMARRRQYASQGWTQYMADGSEWAVGG